MGLLQPEIPVAPQEDNTTRMAQAVPATTPVEQHTPPQVGPAFDEPHGQDPGTSRTVGQSPYHGAPYEQALAPAQDNLPAAPVTASTLRAPSLKDFEDAGFEGLVIGARTFPMISLQKEGNFTDLDGNDYGNVVVGQAISSHIKWVVVAKQPSRVKPGTFEDVDVLFARDRNEIDPWKGQFGDIQGAIFEERKYIDCLVQANMPEKGWDGELHVWSIPEQSQQSFTGAMFKVAFRNKWDPNKLLEHLNETPVILTATVGEGKSGYGPFKKWEFSAKLANV